VDTDRTRVSRYEIWQFIDVFNRTHEENIVQTERLGKAADFSFLQNDIRSLKNITSKLNENIIISAHSNHIERSVDVCLFLQSTLRDIISFDNTKDGWKQIRSDLGEKFSRASFDFSQMMLPILLEDQIITTINLKNKRGDFETSNEESKIIFQFLESIESKNQEIDNYLAKARQNTNESQNLFDSLRANAVRAGLATNSSNFEEEAKNSRKAARFWLSFAGLCGFLLMLWATLNNKILILEKDFSAAQIAQMIFSKFLIVTVLFFFLYQAARNYSNLKHNEIVNRHRHNALGSFMAFVNAAGDDESTKNAVLLSATNTIFSNQPSGYVKEEKDGNLFERVADVAKAAASAKS